MYFLHLFILALLALFSGIILVGISRKISARIHWRYGPPLLQPLIDVIKLFSQNSISHGFFFDFGIILTLVGSFILIFFIPVSNLYVMNSGGLIAVIYIMLLSPFGLAISAAAGANPNASIGITRKFLLSFAYEIPLLLILLSVMTHYNTISLVKIVDMQVDSGWSFGSGTLILSGISYLLILPAILGIRPFEVVNASQEISSGPLTEFGGKHLAFASIQHSLHTYAVLALFVDLFLGGSSLFGLLKPISSTIWGSLIGILVFLVKVAVLMIFCLFINAVFPRYRIDQAMKYIWKWPLLTAFVGLLIVSLLN